MSKTLVIVESPAKIKKIQEYLGEKYIVRASFGHIVNLDSKTLSIDRETLLPQYHIMKDKSKVIKELKELSKKCNVIIATDKDIEGESIGFHLANVLKLKNPQRIVFTEITQKAIDYALANITVIDQSKVNNQQARRVIDRLIGYLLSPILWNNIPNNYTKGESISVGRVQSIILKILSDKITEIAAFTSNKVYNVSVILFKDFKIVTKLKEIITLEKNVTKILEKGVAQNFILTNIKVNRITIKPKPPYITSSLQQEANIRYSMSAKSTMSCAQKLYEAGLITYMRTDSTNLSEDSLSEIKQYICEIYSTEYYNRTIYVKKSKNKTEEAHEAIRPTKINFDNSKIEDEYERKLYILIWQRTVASQMSNHVYDENIYNFQICNYSKYNFISKYNKVVFDGFKKLYNPQEIQDPNDSDSDTELDSLIFHNILETINVDDIFNLNSLNAIEKYKNGPCRYTEGSLIKKLDILGIGRPSTYAIMLSAILTKKYAFIGDIKGEKINVLEINYKNNKLTKNTVETIYGADKKKIIITPLGTLVNNFIELNFNNLINYEFTKLMEEQLDLIEKSKIDWNKVTRQYYKTIMDTIGTISNSTKSNASFTNTLLGNHPLNGNEIIKYISKYGPTVREDLGENNYKYGKIHTEFDNFSLEDAVLLLKYPYTIFNYNNKPVDICNGQYGLYFKYNENNYNLKNYEEENITLDTIKEIISNSTNNKSAVIKKLNDSVSILNGPYGPYIKTSKKNYKIPADYDVEKITIETCKKIISEIPKKKYKKRSA